MSKNLDERTAHYYNDCDFNCCETTRWACNDAFDMKLPQEAFTLASGFGGGCANGDICGAVAAGIMTYGYLNTKERAHVSPNMRKRCRLFMQTVEEKLGSTRCDYLKPKYRDTEKDSCLPVVQMVADIIDQLKEAELPED